jgi:hypothetical protein
MATRKRVTRSRGARAVAIQETQKLQLKPQILPPVHPRMATRKKVTRSREARAVETNNLQLKPQILPPMYTREINQRMGCKSSLTTSLAMCPW